MYRLERACTVFACLHQALEMKGLFRCSTGISQTVRGVYTFDLTLVTRFYSIHGLFPNLYGVDRHGTCPPSERGIRACERARETGLGTRRSWHHSAGPTTANSLHESTRVRPHSALPVGEPCQRTPQGRQRCPACPIA